MAEYVPLEIPDNPKLAQNIIHFGRALRRAGLPIGPGRVIDAIDAVKAAGFTNQQDFYWTLHACFVNRPEHRAVFAQIFRLYWRDPRYLEHMMSMMLPAVRGVQEERAAQAAEKRRERQDEKSNERELFNKDQQLLISKPDLEKRPWKQNNPRINTMHPNYRRQSSMDNERKEL